MAVVGMFLVSAPARAAQFGLKNLSASFSTSEGSDATQAGSHPFSQTVSFDLNTEPVTGGEVTVGALKDVRVELPPGFTGDSSAVPRCSNADFLQHTNQFNTFCPDSSAIGLVDARTGTTSPVHEFTALYNLEPPPGVAARIGFVLPLGFIPFTIDLEVNPNPPYNLLALPSDIPQPIGVYGSTLTVWGNPADPAHDPLRGNCLRSDDLSRGNCPAGVANRPFLWMPRSCTGPLTTTLSADSWQNPGVLVGPYELETPAMSGCAALGFGPAISSQPTSQAASSPTGLDFGLDVKDEGLRNPVGIAQSDIEKAVVTLPEGMTANPSQAVGLSVCTEQDLARETAFSAPGEGCPQASKIGTVEVETPLLEGEVLKGGLFIAAPYTNRFGTLLALYMTIKDPKLGIYLALAGKVEPDPNTGRLTTTFDDLPQQPFSHFRLHFREGDRSPLVTPPACGTYDAKAVLTPWAGGEPITTTSAFQITSGPNAGPCPAGGTPPFAPGATAGTLSNAAGSYSPFDLRITRKDGEQQLTRFSTIMPPGLTGNLNGIPFCPDGAIEAARQKTGAQENSEPSCPLASQIGHTLVGAGVGGVLAWAPGKVYLAGPYNGAPLSVVSVTSAAVGPFDLGTVVIRFALRINPSTAQVEIDSAGSDPIPHIIRGIVVNVREIHAYIDRHDFVINPTNCNPLSIQNTINGAGIDLTSPADDVPVTLNSPFQAADCLNLAFKPSFSVSTSGKTSKANGASLTVKLAYPSAPQGTQANIRSVRVELPKQLPSRLTTLQKACTAAQFDTNPAGCPAASVIGHAKAITPILPVPLEGPAYFVSNGGEAFPNLIMVLQGYGITIDLVGDTFISKAGITSSTFKTVPDQPVSSFELVLPQGPFSALTANGNLCTSKLTMPTEFVAQNGMPLNQNTPVNVTGCPKIKTLTRPQKLALALKVCHKQHNHAKRKACERAARKKYGPLKAKKAKQAKR